MLPQVAAGMLATRHIVMPIRTIIKKTTFYEGRVKNIDPYGKIVNLWSIPPVGLPASGARRES